MITKETYKPLFLVLMALMFPLSFLSGNMVVVFFAMLGFFFALWIFYSSKNKEN